MTPTDHPIRESSTLVLYDIIEERFEEIRSLGGVEEMEHYIVEVNELTKLFERKPK